MTDKSSGRIVVEKLERADTWGSRFKGLLGRKRLDEGGGLYLEPCRQVHCFFMKFAIDVVFVDEQSRAVGLEKDLRPWRISRYHPRAVGALELPSGTIERLGIQEGISILEGLRPTDHLAPPSTDRETDEDRDHVAPNAAEKPKEYPDARHAKPQCFH